jgi:hypothetical protein
MFWRRRIRELRAELARIRGSKPPSAKRVVIRPLPSHTMSDEEAARYAAREGELQRDEWED